jgi:hypothetical protein
MAATIDTAAILIEEYARISDSNNLLPEQVAAHGAAGIANDVARILEERGQSRFSADQYRSAVRECFRRLLDDKGNIADRPSSPQLAAEQQIKALDNRVRLILGREQFADAEYRDVLATVMEAGWPPRVQATEERELTRAEEAKLRGDILEQLAKQRLRDKGIDPGSANYEELASAYDEADFILTEKENN